MLRKKFLREMGLWALIIAALSLWISPSYATEKDTQQTQMQCTEVVINEYMSARQRTIADADGDHEDWIELYNCSDEDIDLTDWYLSDRYDRPQQWQFPTTTIPAKGFLTLWASGKDRTDDNELHTNFRIDAAGEPLLLSNADGELIDEIPPIAVSAHETVGRYPDGVGDIAVLTEPTPNAPNTEPIAPALIDAPEFSHESGFYDKEFTLTLSHPGENVTIYYTLDGSEPDPDNLDGSTYRYKNSYQQPPKEEGQKIEISQDFLYNEYKTYQYDKPIAIKDRTYEPDRISQISTTFDENPDYFPEPEEADHWINDAINQTNRGIKELNRFGRRINRLGNRAIRKYYKVTTGEVRPLGDRQFVAKAPEIGDRLRKLKYTFKGTPVRAVAVKENEHRRTISPIATNTYFIGDREEFSLPIVAITVSEKELFDYDEGILVAGAEYDEWLAIEGDDHDSPRRSNNNWLQNRKINSSITFMESQEFVDVDDAKIRMHGAYSRRFRNKSIRLYPNNSKYSNYAVFDDERPLGHNRINFRNSGNNAGNNYINDAAIQAISAGLSFGVQRYRPYAAFINGEFNGVLNARDRRDLYYLQSEYDLPTQEIDHLKRNYIVMAGSASDWEELLELAQANLGKTQPKGFSELYEKIDIDSLIDYQVAEIFVANTDWPGNNIAYWKYKGAAIPENDSTDGKWRWLMYDTDHGLGFSSFNKEGVEHKSIEYASSSERGKSNLIFRFALLDPEFRKKFSIRYADLLNTTFKPERTESIIRTLEKGIEDIMPKHINRWRRPGHMKNWRASVNRMVDFAEKRPAIQREHLQEFFELGDLYTLSLRVLVQGEDGHIEPGRKTAVIKLNTLTLGVSDDELEKPVAASARATNMEKYLALPWSGEYFAGMPIQLSVEPRPGYRFSHWAGRGVPEDQKNNPQVELVPEADTIITAVMKPD